MISIFSSYSVHSIANKIGYCYCARFISYSRQSHESVVCVALHFLCFCNFFILKKKGAIMVEEKQGW